MSRALGCRADSVMRGARRHCESASCSRARGSTSSHAPAPLVHHAPSIRGLHLERASVQSCAAAEAATVLQRPPPRPEVAPAPRMPYYFRPAPGASDLAAPDRWVLDAAQLCADGDFGSPLWKEGDELPAEASKFVRCVQWLARIPAMDEAPVRQAAGYGLTKLLESAAAAPNADGAPALLAAAADALRRCGQLHGRFLRSHQLDVPVAALLRAAAEHDATYRDPRAVDKLAAVQPVFRCFCAQFWERVTQQDATRLGPGVTVVLMREYVALRNWSPLERDTARRLASMAMQNAGSMSAKQVASALASMARWLGWCDALAPSEQAALAAAITRVCASGESDAVTYFKILSLLREQQCFLTPEVARALAQALPGQVAALKLDQLCLALARIEALPLPLGRAARASICRRRQDHWRRPFPESSQH
jgi:hypothetical protein